MKFTSIYSSEIIGLNDIVACMNPDWFSSETEYLLQFLIDCKAGNNGYKVAFLTSSELEGLIDRIIQKLV